jgi:uncharacterized protein (TIGR02099 family)
MNKFRHPLQKILVDISIILILGYIILFIGLSALANIILFNANNYKQQIEQTIASKTNYILQIESIGSRFDYDYLPEITLNGVLISSKDNPAKKLAINQILLNLSYSSLWNFELIFNKIAIDKTSLQIQYNSNGDVLLNGMLIVNLKNQSSHKKSTFDVEGWLLKQHNLVLNNINITVLDNKNNLDLISLNNITIIYNNSLFSDRHLQLTVNNNQAQNHIFLDLIWNGGKLEQLKQWKYAHLTLKTDSNSSVFAKNIQQYFPNLGFIKKYTSKTVVNAILENGRLADLTSNLNLSHLSYTDSNKNNINFPNISGVVNIHLNKKTSTYDIDAESIQITTTNGSIIDNKSITGYYTIDKVGAIEAFDSNLNGINNLLNKFPTTKNIKLSGQISHSKLSWIGNIFHPASYLIELNFNNIGITQPYTKFPQINHLYGNASIGQKSGRVTLNLESSNFIYQDLFYVPYEIKHFNSNLSWQIKPDKTIAITLESATINVKDFNAIIHGSYTYVPNTSGYLALYAKLDKVPASRVGYYLPKPIDSANQWLQTALVGGYGESATLTLEGWLKDFPFAKNNSGKFYIDAIINNGKLRYISGWPTIDNVYGKFMIRNQKIIITASSAKVSGNNLSNTEAIIPNMLANQSYLEATGNGNGTTQNFINYLRHTPIDKLLDKLPSSTNAKGNGTVSLYLKVPFDDPNNTSVKGTYNFINNQIQFNHLPIPVMNNTNGSLDFSNQGLAIKNISATSLGGNVTVSAITPQPGKMSFNVQAKDINFNQLMALYLPPVAPIINGNSDATLKLSVSQRGLESLIATSSLNNIQINAPTPLTKHENESTILNFALKQLALDGYSITFNYANALSGTTQINNQAQLTNANIVVGSFKSSLSNLQHLPAVITIAAAPESFELIDWLTTLHKTFLKPATSMQSSKHNKNNTNLTGTEDYSGIYPIDVLLNTANFSIAKIGFGKAQAHAHITKDTVAFNLGSNRLDGYGAYLLAQNSLTLTYNFANIDINHNESSIKKTTIPYIMESHFITTSLEESSFDRLLTNNQLQAAAYASSISRELNLLPTTKVNIKKLYLNGNPAGNVSLNIKNANNNLIIESAFWNGSYAKYQLDLTDYCYQCSSYHSLVDTQIQLNISDLGKFLSNFGLDGIIAQTSGTVKLRSQWRGSINDFSLKSSATKINLDLRNGRFLKVDTGTILGGIIGIINLQTLVNLVSLNFKDIFANGFAFNNLEADAYLLDNVLYLKYFYMSSSIAVVGLKGTINLNDNIISMYLNVTPRLGIGVAVGAGIITLNPLVGVATYLAELALQNPVNKLFAFTFYLSGDVKKPTVRQISISKQLTKNISSTVGQ